MGEAGKKICLASLQDQPCLVCLGDAEGSTKAEFDLKLDTSNTYSAQPKDNHNHTFDQVEKNLIHGSFTTPGASVTFNTKQTYERKASKTDMDQKLATEKELKRLKRIMSNRVSSEKYRMKKMIYVEHLEKQLSGLQLQNSDIRQQIDETTNQKRSLLVEQHHLKFQIAAFEKERIVKEAEIETNIAEVNRLRELQINQLQAKQHEINAELSLNL